MVFRWCPSLSVVFRWVVSRCRSAGPVVSLSMLRRCPGRVPVVSQWFPRRVPVVFQWCPSGVPVVGVPVVSRWCPSGVPVVFQWCPGRVPVVFPCSQQCVLAVSLSMLQWCPGGVAAVGVPVVSRWCSSGVQWCPGGWCPSGVSVVSQWCSSGVLVGRQGCPVVVPPSGVPIVSRSCPVLFPNSHQVWDLLLTRFTFVLASIFGECTIRCPGLFSSWCPSGVPAVSQWRSGGFLEVSRWCLCVAVLVRSCPGSVSVVSRWCLSQCCDGVPVASRWCSSGVPVVGVPVVSQWCPSGVPVVSWSCIPVFAGILVVRRGCPGGVPPTIMSRSCPVFPVSW